MSLLPEEQHRCLLRVRSQLLRGGLWNGGERVHTVLLPTLNSQSGRSARGRESARSLHVKKGIRSSEEVSPPSPCEALRVFRNSKGLVE